MKYPIVVANSYMQAAQYALANPNRRASYPYTAAFLKCLYGTVNPHSDRLMSFGWRQVKPSAAYTRRERYYQLLEQVLTSEGRNDPYPLPCFVSQMMFPYVHHRKEQRRTHRIDADVGRAMRISQRKTEQNRAQLEAEFLALDVSDIVDWVDDHSVECTDTFTRYLLSLYWQKHDTSGESFHDLYPREIHWSRFELLVFVMNDIKL